MSKNAIEKVVWTHQALKSLTEILDYRYKDIPKVRKVIRKEILSSSKKIVFAEQFQKDEIFPVYRRIIVREYKLLYKEEKKTIYIMNIVCTRAK
jgi:addiction module RelE/StbE family toxin